MIGRRRDGQSLKCLTGVVAFVARNDSERAEAWLYRDRPKFRSRQPRRIETTHISPAHVKDLAPRRICHPARGRPALDGDRSTP